MPSPTIIHREDVAVHFNYKDGVLVGYYLFEFFRNDGERGNVTVTVSFKCGEGDEREDVWSKVVVMDRDEEVLAMVSLPISGGCVVFQDFNCCPQWSIPGGGGKLFYFTWAVRPTAPGDKDSGDIRVFLDGSLDLIRILQQAHLWG